MKKTLITLLVATLAGTAFAEETAKSKAKAEEEKKETNNFSLSFLTDITTGMSTLNRGTTDNLASGNYLTFGYKLSETESISYTAYFTSGRPTLSAKELYTAVDKDTTVLTEKTEKGSDEEKEQQKLLKEHALTMSNTQRFTNGDHYVKYSNSKVKLLGERAVSGRVYLPTSDSSDLTGKIKFRADTAFSRELSDKFSLSYSVSPRYSFYTKAEAGQTAFELLQGVGVGQKINDKLSATYTVYLYNAFANTGSALSYDSLNADGSYTGTKRTPVEDTSLNYVSLYADLSFSATDNLSIIGYVMQDRNVEHTNAVIPFNEDESKYGLMLSVKL